MRRWLSVIYFGILIFPLLSCYPTYKTTVQKKTSQVQADFNAARYETDILKYINRVRSNPQSFYTNYIKKYIKQHPDRFTSYYTESLKNEIHHLSSLPSLKPDNELKQIAQKQVNYLAHQLNGKKLTHNQGILSFQKRLKNIPYNAFAENLYRAQKNNPLELVMDLLIDQGVHQLGHRKNILSKTYLSIGIKSAKAKNGYIVTVIDFGRK